MRAGQMVYSISPFSFMMDNPNTTDVTSWVTWVKSRELCIILRPSMQTIISVTQFVWIVPKVYLSLSLLVGSFHIIAPSNPYLTITWNTHIYICESYGFWSFSSSSCVCTVVGGLVSVSLGLKQVCESVCIVRFNERGMISRVPYTLYS